MSTVNPGYLIALQEHANECETDIKELLNRLNNDQWGRFEERVAERTLQVLIESAIGAAKHWSKKIHGQVSGDAYLAFSRLADHGIIDSTGHWRSMIGLRKALVHEYLEVDPDIVVSVLKNHQYEVPLNFLRDAIQALR